MSYEILILVLKIIYRSADVFLKEESNSRQKHDKLVSYRFVDKPFLIDDLRRKSMFPIYIYD